MYFYVLSSKAWGVGGMDKKDAALPKGIFTVTIEWFQGYAGALFATANCMTL